MTAARNLTIEDIVDKLEELPTLPPIVYELSRIINDPMSMPTDIEKVMTNDQSMTAKVLKLANSAYYGVPGGVTNLAKAIGYLGYDTVHQLVLSASIIEALEVSGPTKFDLNEFWKHSIGVAMAAETIATRVGVKTPADLFTCGLIHDMGKVAWYIVDADIFLNNVETAAAANLSLLEAENQNDVVPHTKMGHLLAKQWLLPNQLQICIMHHHTPAESPERQQVAAEMNQYIDIVHLANLMIHALKFGDSGHKKVLGLNKAIFERLGMQQSDLKDLTVSIKKTLEDASGFLSIIMGS